MNGPAAFYNECDPFAAQWLRNLIAAGYLAPGSVDARSIAAVRPGEIGAGQAHFFAGIGVWSYALRLAGWPDDVPVWTGSCPCQPFSAAGRKRGFADERHLWPEWFRLIRECHPAIVLGEQVASAGDWLDVVSRDMEGEGYAFAASVLGAHSVGAPHIRQRFYFVAHAEGYRAARDGGDGGEAHCQAKGDLRQRQDEALGRAAQSFVGSASRELADSVSAGRAEGRAGSGRGSFASCGGVGGVEHAAGEQVGFPGRARIEGGTIGELAHSDGGQSGDGDLQRSWRHLQRAENPPAGFWSDAEWIPCSDGKSRPVEPGTFPLAHGAPARVGRLRAYGNALVAETARCFVSAVMEIL